METFLSIWFAGQMGPGVHNIYAIPNLLSFSTIIAIIIAMIVIAIYRSVFLAGITFTGLMFISMGMGTEMITNLSQTKFIKLSTCELSYSTYISSEGNSYDDYTGAQYLHSDEIYKDKTISKKAIMKYNNKEPHSYTIITDRIWNNYLKYNDKPIWSPDYVLHKVDGVLVKRNTGQRPTDDDYYLYDHEKNSWNVPRKYGGLGIPQWLFNNSSFTLIFGICIVPGALLARAIKS